MFSCVTMSFQSFMNYESLFMCHCVFRKRCMDLISIENQAEQNFIGQNMARAGVREVSDSDDDDDDNNHNNNANNDLDQVWTSGRLCDKEVDGCEQPR